MTKMPKHFETLSPVSNKNWQPPAKFQFVSLKSVAKLLDSSRSSARRWLQQAGIKPITMGKGPKSAIRYRWDAVEKWLESRQYVE